MKKLILFIILSITTVCSKAQRQTENDGNWSLQFLVLKQTAEADVMIRVGDIDNLGFGFHEDFNPFTGKSTDSHGFPWNADPADAKGTDRIMVPGSYKPFNGKNQDGYTSTTQRPKNNPASILIPLRELRGQSLDSAALQVFIDDFQSPSMQSRFQFKVNGLRFTESEKMIAHIDQTGPVGKLITIRFTPELMQKLTGDSLVISIDDMTTGTGDGFAIDFVKLLVNPRLIYKGIVQGIVVDKTNGEPIAGARVEVAGYGNAVTGADGSFELADIPAGLALVTGSATGYSSGVKQADVIAGETTTDIRIELAKSQAVVFNNKKLQEGDKLVLNNIQFAVNSAALLPAGKTELDKLASFMKQNNRIEIQLSGHTSAEGSAAGNRELSLKRVRSCKDYLAAKGIDESRITIRGFGPDRPFAPNDSEANRALNRRVEMEITSL